MKNTWNIDYDCFLLNKQHAPQLTNELNHFTEKAIYQSVPQGWSKLIQANGANLYSYFPEKVRLYISSVTKKKQGQIANNKQELLNNFLQMVPDHITKKISGEITPLPIPKNTVLITHDVDYVKCYDFLLKLAEYENKQGISAAFYFLTSAGYKIESTVIRTLKEMGHEVGLHGNRYDLRLAYRNLPTIIKNLSYAKSHMEDHLGEKIYGFRNHSLILSHNILQAIKELGFKYDSGIYPRANLNPLSRWFCWPFKYFNESLWELPVAWPQDADVFRKYNFNEKQTIELYLSTLDGILGLLGLCCFNFHPSIISNNYNTFKKIIGLIQERKCVFTSPISIVDNVENKERHLATN